MRNKKLIFVMALILSFAIVITGCSSSKSMQNDSSTGGSRPPSTAPEESIDFGSNAEMENMFTQDEASVIEPDKIITTVYVSMQTKDFMETVEKLNALITKYKGYIESSNVSHNNYVYSTGLKYSDYSIRIPRENLKSFNAELIAIGNIIHENTSKMNITKQYRDTESRLKVLEVKEGRILALLEKAEKMEDIIALENQLSTIIYEKENLTANIMDMDDKVNYTTVQLQLEEVGKLTPGENVKTPFWTKVANAFKNSAYYFGRDIENLMISLIYFLPYGIILGIIIYVVWRFAKKRKNKFFRNDKKHKDDIPKE